jgi:cysteine desulfurase
VIYLDHAATAPMWPAVREAMLPWLGDRFANASSVYASAREARKAIEDAREIIAAAVQARPDEVIFTSGGTESDNLAVLGGARRAKKGGKPGVVVSAIEHHAVLDPALHLKREGHEVRLLPVTADGVVDLDRLGSFEGVGLVSVMTVNNETGAIQPVAKVAEVARAAGALMHTDAVQALPWIDVDARTVDLLTLAAHKCGGPKGVGALIIRRGAGVEPLVHGGGQERAIRSGTYDVASIVGFGVAVTEVLAARAAGIERVRALRDRLQAALTDVPGVRATAANAERTANTLHLTIERVVAEPLLLLLDGAGIAASSGSACSSGAAEPSHVLTAMGYSPDLASGALRLTLGYGTTDADIDAAIPAVTDAIARLRR